MVSELRPAKEGRFAQMAWAGTWHVTKAPPASFPLQRSTGCGRTLVDHTGRVVHEVEWSDELPADAVRCTAGGCAHRFGDAL